MLDEFSYLGTKRAFEVVVTNPNAIADKVAPDIKPFPHGTFPPIIDTAADEIRETRRAVEELYTFRGQVSQVVEERLNKELNSIIGNGFAIMYYIAYMLVKKSNEDGYIVGQEDRSGPRWLQRSAAFRRSILCRRITDARLFLFRMIQADVSDRV